MAAKKNKSNTERMDDPRTAVVLANGRPPTKALLSRHLGEEVFFVCADGGANAAAKMNIEPDLIIGDLDSIDESTLEKFAGIRTRRIADQNSTDLEKAMQWLVRKGYAEVRIFGATGGRIDHTLGNLSCVAKFQRKARLSIHDEDGIIYPVLSLFEREFPVGTTVSLLPLSLCEGVITRGLKWNLRYESLGLGSRDGISNVTTAKKVSIQVRRGTMMIFVRSDV